MLVLGSKVFYYENMKDQLKCGACGNETFRLFGSKYGDGVLGLEEMRTECTKCFSISHIKQAKPRMTIEWGTNAQGILCFMN